MSPATRPPAAFSGERREILRWAICFAVVVAAHGMGFAALLSSEMETSDIGLDEPVVMIDLPESLVATPTPPKDAAPGPMEEEESLPTPPQKEETKPPEEQAELAIPMPEPPKPEPPSEEKHATAPPAAKTPPRTVVRWQSMLAAHIEHFKRYPFEARERGEQGIATVAFTIDREGHVLMSRIVQSSGSAMLDQETLAMLSRAQPMPRPPEDIADDKLTFLVPVRFNIK
jgi:periplasmic protein TonB